MEGGKLSDSLADRQESRRLRCSSESLVFDTFGFGMESEPLSLDRTTAGTPTEVSRRHFDHDFSETSYQAACSTPPDSSPPRSRLECPPSPSPLRTCQGPLRATTAKRPRSRLFGDTEGELQDETRRLSLFSGDDDDVLIPFRSNGKRARNCLFGDHDTDEVPAESGSSLCFGSLLTHDENSENTNLPVPTLRSSRDDSFVTPQHKPIRPKTTSLSVTHSYKRPGYLMPGHMSGQALFSSSQQDPPGNLVLTKSVLMPKSPCRPTQRPNPKSPSRPTLPRFTQNPWSPRPPVRSSPKEETNDQADLNTLQNTSLYNLLFKEIDYLGEGSFGTVYQCRHIVDGWDYAVKISKKPLRGSKDFQGRLQEVFALAALPGHPNLVRYYNAWVYDGLLYIQMEFCDGGTLLGNEKEFRQHELAEIMLQLASGLDCLHSHKMVHKDVKPENIYISITEEGKKRYKIGDFGLIKGKKSGTDPDMNGDGDCRYLAPEVLNSPSTPQSDIYSLGMSIIHLATGVDPPKHVQQRKTFALPPRFNPEFHNLLQKMIDPDPSMRPTAKDLLRHPLLIPNAISPRFHQEVLEENELLRKEVADLKERLRSLAKSMEN